MAAPVRRAADPDLNDRVTRQTLPGHDRDVAKAILNQARLGSPLDDVQVAHLVSIGWNAGCHAGMSYRPASWWGRLRWAFRARPAR